MIRLFPIYPKSASQIAIRIQTGNWFSMAYIALDLLGGQYLSVTMAFCPSDTLTVFAIIGMHNL
jgi:hypothetical protein